MQWATNLLSSISSSTNNNNNNTSSSSSLLNVGLEFFTDLKKLNGWADLDSLFLQPQLASLRQVEIGLFAIPTHSDFIKVKEEMSGLESRGIARWYQLGIKNRRSTRQLTPRISRYESWKKKKKKRPKKKKKSVSYRSSSGFGFFGFGDFFYFYFFSSFLAVPRKGDCAVTVWWWLSSFNRCYYCREIRQGRLERYAFL